jgi:hypothetical protein
LNIGWLSLANRAPITPDPRSSIINGTKASSSLVIFYI